MFAKRFEAEAKKFLDELRKSGDDRIQMSAARRPSSGADARRAGRASAPTSRSRPGGAASSSICRRSICSAIRISWRAARALLGLDVPLAVVDAASRPAPPSRARLPVVPLGLAVTAAPGKPDATSAPAAIASIRRAVADVLAGRAAAVVTNPVAKNVLYRSGFAEPGHTEFLAKLAAGGDRQAGAAGDDAVVARTRGGAGHHPSAAARRGRSASPRDLIVETGRIVARDLTARFGIARPRLAVAGLNPHAGEDGALGEEDRAIVAPAVERLRAEGIDARGPLPADTHVPRARRARPTTRRSACITTRR